MTFEFEVTATSGRARTGRITTPRGTIETPVFMPVGTRAAVQTLTSHDVADIEHVADRAIIVNHGMIIYDAPVADLRTELFQTKQVDVGLDDRSDVSRLRSVLGDGVSVAEPAPAVSFNPQFSKR